MRHRRCSTGSSGRTCSPPGRDRTRGSPGWEGLLVSAAELVPVVALEERAHRQEILDGDAVLSRVRMGEGAAVLEVRGDAGGDACGQELAIDRRAHQVARDGLGRRARVEQCVLVRRAEVALEGQRSMSGDQDRGELHQRAGADLVLDGLERPRVESRRRRVGLGPACPAGGEGHREQRTEQQHDVPRAGQLPRGTSVAGGHCGRAAVSTPGCKNGGRGQPGRIGLTSAGPSRSRR